MITENWKVVSGLVIIHQGRVLLIKETKEGAPTPWMFPGGQVEDSDVSFETAAIREANEEVGFAPSIEKALHPVLLHRGAHSYALMHFLARGHGQIIKGKEVLEAEWFDLHNIPVDCAPNVPLVIKQYMAHL